MDIDITCSKASEYLSDHIDGRLDPELEAPLASHLERCGNCRTELSLLEDTRQLLRTRLKPVSTPGALRARILRDISSVHAASGSPSLSHGGGLASMFTFTYWRVPLAFAGALALALVAFTLLLKKSPHQHTRPFDGSVVTESFNNFDQVVEGKLTPGIVSDKPGEVRAFLEKRVHFPVQVPKMKDFRLVGGQFSAADNETTAHIIYERNGNYVYISQSDARRLIGGKRRFIPQPALDDIRRSGWYFAGNETDCNLAMWLADSTLCTAVADINRQNLLMNIGGVAAR
jgi:anti-sigma factor RsiW